MSECLLVAHKHQDPQENKILAEFCQANDIKLYCASTPEEARQYISEATIMHSDYAKLIPLADKLKWFSSISSGESSSSDTSEAMAKEAAIFISSLISEALTSKAPLKMPGNANTLFI